MTRRRVTSAGVVVVLIVVGVLAALTARDGDDGAPAPPGPRAVAYARTWEATCGALRADATRTAALVRARTGGGEPGTRLRRRLATGVVAPYLGRTERRLRRVAAAAPPPEWLAYHRAAVVELRRAVAATGAARARVRRGDLAALTDAGASPGPPATTDAPDELRRRTPACTGARGT